MGVKIRKRGGKWYVFVNYHGRRKAKCVGTSRELAEQVRRQLEAKLALGDLGFLSEEPVLTVRQYSETWLKQYAELELKQSTVDFYQDYQRRYVFPRFGELKLTAITRDDVKSFAADLNARGLARNTIRLAVAALRVVLSAAVEDGILSANPAAKMGRFVQSHKTEHQAQAMAPHEVERFLEAAKEYCPTYYPLFLIALRGGLRQGEILALKWGDFQFGQGELDLNRYIVVQRRWYRGRFSTPKGNKSRRVDISRELRRVLLDLRDERMLEAFQAGRSSIADDLLFRGEKGNPISVRTLVENYFLPSLERAGLRRFRFHDMRHTFGSLLTQSGAPLPYVRDQMGHSSIQITADKYVHLISGRNVGFVDRLDEVAKPAEKRAQQESDGNSVEEPESEPNKFLPQPESQGQKLPPRLTSAETTVEVERIAAGIMDTAQGELGEAIRLLRQLSAQITNPEQDDAGPQILQAIHRLHAARYQDAEPVQADPFAAIAFPIETRADKFQDFFSQFGSQATNPGPGKTSSQQTATQAQPEAASREGSAEQNEAQVAEGKAWCERGDSNPHGLTRQILSLVRLPIPPLSQPEWDYTKSSGVSRRRPSRGATLPGIPRSSRFRPGYGSRCAGIY